jgi:hypothetical protein
MHNVDVKSHNILVQFCKFLWLAQYNGDIVESDVKHHKHKPIRCITCFMKKENINNGEMKCDFEIKKKNYMTILQSKVYLTDLTFNLWWPERVIGYRFLMLIVVNIICLLDYLLSKSYCIHWLMVTYDNAHDNFFFLTTIYFYSKCLLHSYFKSPSYLWSISY